MCFWREASVPASLGESSLRSHFEAPPLVRPSPVTQSKELPFAYLCLTTLLFASKQKITETLPIFPTVLPEVPIT